MNDSEKILVVFCEGAHDVTFVYKIFEHCLAYKSTKLKFSEYPFPFNKLFKSSISHHADKDLSLDMAHKFFLPGRALKKGQQWVLLFNSGGDGQVKKLKQYLAKILLLEDDPEHDDTRAFNDFIDYLFIYDADDIGVGHRVKKAQGDFSQVDDEPFIEGDFAPSQQSEYGYIHNNKAVFVWGENTAQGTLEDWLIPMHQQQHSANLNKAYSTLDEMFEWQDNIAQQSKRHKAAMTLIGQKQNPGYSLAVVLADETLLTKDVYQTSDNVKGFVKFLNEFADV
ncbi:MAG: hypothetical protein ACI8WB_005538 [Phenylobacterium sp.]|jgi:hypothetical protein